jgi:hypothetical protein
MVKIATSGQRSSSQPDRRSRQTLAVVVCIEIGSGT